MASNLLDKPSKDVPVNHKVRLTNGEVPFQRFLGIVEYFCNEGHPFQSGVVQYFYNGHWVLCFKAPAEYSLESLLSDPKNEELPNLEWGLTIDIGGRNHDGHGPVRLTAKDYLRILKLAKMEVED